MGQVRALMGLPAAACRGGKQIKRHLDIGGPRPRTGKARKGAGHRILHVKGGVATPGIAGDGKGRLVLADHFMEAAAPLRGVGNVEGR